MKILITGSATGIGQALKKKFQSHGHIVMGTFHHHRESGDTADDFYLDLADDESIKRLANSIDDIDILINNAFWMDQNKPLLKLSFDDITRIINTNLAGTFKITTALLPKVKKGIINIGSSVTYSGVHKSSSLYRACKAGVTSLTKSLADETDLLVYTIHPSKTAVSRNNFHGVPVERVVEVIYNIVIGKYRSKYGSEIRVRDYRWGPHLRLLLIALRFLKNLFFGSRG